MKLEKEDKRLFFLHKAIADDTFVGNLSYSEFSLMDTVLRKQRYRQRHVRKLNTIRKKWLQHVNKK